MGELVLIDSQIFIWGIKSQANAGQEGQIVRAKNLIKWIDEREYRILIATPQLTELLSPIPLSHHAELFKLFDKRFAIAPFDNLAAGKCADLIHKCLNEDELKQYREENAVPKNKVKFDCMLVATAITNKAIRIFSEDGDLKRFANGEIPVDGMGVIEFQTEMDLKTRPDNYASDAPQE